MGFIGITLSVCLTVRLFTSCLGHNFVPPCLFDLGNISHNCCPWPKSVSWPWPKVISGYLQGHSEQIPKICLGAITPYCQVRSGKYFTHLFSMTQWCVITFVQGHISKVNVTMHTYRKLVYGPLFFNAKLDLNNISNKCCPWPNGVSWPCNWLKVISKGQGRSAHTQNLCPSHISSQPSWIWIIFHTIIVPRGCHGLDLRSYLQCQGHSAHIPKIHVQAITP